MRRLTGRHLAAIVLATGLAAVVEPAPASMISYNLVGNTSDAQLSIIEASEIRAGIPLTDASTGFTTEPGFVLNVGDTISGTVSLDHPFTVPSSSSGLIGVSLFTTPSDTIHDTESVTLSDAGIPVSLAGSAGFVGGNGVQAGEFSAANPSFTFDQINFSTTIDSIVNADSQSVSSVTLSSSVPMDLAVIWEPAPVPLPSSAWLMVSGLVGLVAMARRRKGAFRR